MFVNRSRTCLQRWDVTSSSGHWKCSRRTGKNALDRTLRRLGCLFGETLHCSRIAAHHSHVQHRARWWSCGRANRRSVAQVRQSWMRHGKISAELPFPSTYWSVMYRRSDFSAAPWICPAYVWELNSFSAEQCSCAPGCRLMRLMPIAVLQVRSGDSSASFPCLHVPECGSDKETAL